MANANLIKGKGEEVVRINSRQICESDKNGIIVFNKEIQEPIFIYDKKTGEKITDWTKTNSTITLKKSYHEVFVDYWYTYSNGFSTFEIGRPLINGFLSLTGKMRVKDDTGKVVTAIIDIPKLRLMSDLSMRVGSDAIPQVGRLDAVAVPEGVRGQ